MKGKILFVVGLGAGYVLGARAGRERYEQIRKAAMNVWNQPQVQQGVGTVKEFAKTRVGDLSGTVLDGVKGLIGNATKNSDDTTSATSSTRSTTRPSPTTSTKSSKPATGGAKRSSSSRGEELAPPTGTATNPASSSSGDGSSASSGA